MNAVLKAGAIPTTEPSSALRAMLPAASPPPGRWLGEPELKTLLTEAFERGVHEGRQQAEQRLVESARRDAEAAARQAMRKALADHQAEVDRVQAAKWQGLATSLADQMRALREAVESEVTEWTFVATTRLLGEMSADQLRSSVRRVLDEAGLREPVQVLVHADDHAILGVEPSSWPAGVQFVADATVGVGGCVVRMPAQTLDARLEVQLTFLRQALDSARRERLGMER